MVQPNSSDRKYLGVFKRRRERKTEEGFGTIDKEEESGAIDKEEGSGTIDKGKCFLNFLKLLFCFLSSLNKTSGFLPVRCQNKAQIL